MIPIIRYMTPDHLADVARIERDACARPWSEQRLKAVFNQKGVLGKVATNLYGTVVGYTLYELLPQSIQIRSLVVAPAYQRRHVGTALMRGLHAELRRRSRFIINAQVTDDLKGAHLFLKAQGFRAIEVIRGDERDVYLFEYRAPALQRPVPVHDCGDQVP